MVKLSAAAILAAGCQGAAAFEPSTTGRTALRSRGQRGQSAAREAEGVSFAGASAPSSIQLAGGMAAAAAVVAAIVRRARKPVVGGNWKCNPESMKALDGLIANINACDTSKCDVYVCPSSLHISYCTGKFTNGAAVTPQNCNFKGCGAYTGEMAVEQMKDMGITQVLIGHSERRGEFGIFPMDDNATLATKLKYILDAGMSCVFCIGEPKAIRETGLDAVLKEMDVQLAQVYKLLDPKKVVIAYEPVWAIGTGLTATPADAQATHAGIRKLIAEKASPEVASAIRIQYGGSANAANAPELSAQPDIDGFLVGGASLKPEFAEIVATISSEKAKAKFDPAEEVGVTDPLGYFDPAGFCKDEENFRSLRAAEIKHGRVAMMAAVGGVVQHFVKLPGFESVPSGLSAVTAPPGTYGFAALFVIAGGLELALWTESPEKEPGNFGDPVGLGQYTLEMRNRELNNGRMAMFAAMGIISAELLTGKDGVQQLGL